MKELKHLNKYFLKYKSHLLIGIVITIVARIFLLFTPRYIRRIFEIIENKAGLEETEIRQNYSKPFYTLLVQQL